MEPELARASVGGDDEGVDADATEICTDWVSTGGRCDRTPCKDFMQNCTSSTFARELSGDGVTAAAAANNRAAATRVGGGAGLEDIDLRGSRGIDSSAAESSRSEERGVEGGAHLTRRRLVN